MDFLQTIYTDLLNNGVNGLHAIQYIYFIVIALIIKNDFFNKIEINNNQNIESFVKKIICIYNIFGIVTKLNIKEITSNLYDTIKIIDVEKINKINILDKIYKYYLNTENLYIIKDYIKYYNNRILSEWILNIGNPHISDQSDQVDKIFIGNTKINGYLDIIIEKCQEKKINFNKISDKLYGYHNNLIVKSLVLSNFLLNSDINLNQNFICNDILIKDIELPVKIFDLIYFDFPTGIHNIIYANCCNKIKKLKLRGTKYEPLLLQLILCSLNKNGRAVLVVPDSLLFSESIQTIQTRKYMMKYFNVKKIIQIDESLYMGKENKNSVLYLENNGTTKSIDFTKIYIDTNEKCIKETKQITVVIDKIKSNIYSLYYKNYELIKNLKEDLKLIKFEEVFEFKTNKDTLPNSNFICLEKYYKNENSIKITSKNHDCWEHYIVEKNTDSNSFNIRLLQNILKTKYQNLVKGKMNQIDLIKISQIEFPIISNNIKQSICEYINITNKLISDNREQICSTLKLKYCLMNSISLNKMINIEKIAQLYNKKSLLNTKLTKKIISILRNGLSAGHVNLIDSNENMINNSHYLILTDSNYTLDFIYHWLKHNEILLKEQSNLNPQPNLSQTSLLNFKIPDISIENQIEIVSCCNDFDSIISKYEAINKYLVDKDILGIFYSGGYFK